MKNNIQELALMPMNNISVKLLLLLSLLLFAFEARAEEETIPDYGLKDESQIAPEFNSLLSDFKKMIGIKDLPNDTLAIVNEEIITLRDVEALANLNYTPRSDEYILSLDYVLEEYSDYLFELIEQKIIAKAIDEQNISVTYSDVEQIEEIIRQSYEGTFDEELESEGIDIELWRSQLKRRLEKEALQLTIISQIRISPQEIIDYQEENSQLFVIPEKYKVLMLSSYSQKILQEAHKKNIRSIEDAEKFDVLAQEGLFTTTNLPEEWDEDTVIMEKTGKTHISHSGNSYKYLILLEKIPATTMSQEDIFLQVEQQLREEKADRAYKQWLAQALNSTEIQIIPEFASILQGNSEIFIQ